MRDYVEKYYNLRKSDLVKIKLGFYRVENKKVNISKNTLFKGEISAAVITVEGKIIGNLQATSSILIKEDGWVKGNIQAPTIYLEKGCYHEGAIYLEAVKNAASAKINMNKHEFNSGHKDEAKTGEDESSKGKPVSSSPISKL